MKRRISLPIDLLSKLDRSTFNLKRISIKFHSNSLIDDIIPQHNQFLQQTVLLFTNINKYNTNFNYYTKIITQSYYNHINRKIYIYSNIINIKKTSHIYNT